MNFIRVPRTAVPSERSTVPFLERFPLFQDLDSEAIARLARGAVEFVLPEESIVFRQSDIPSGIYCIVDGQVKLSLQTAKGDEKVIELLGPGESFGAVPVFLGEQQSLTAGTAADSVLVHVGKTAVLEELERNPSFSRRMLREVCLRLQQRTRDFGDCVALNGAQRVAGFLLTRIPAGINGKSVAVTLPAKKGIIASRLNLTHEHFSRILHEIEAAGLIEVRGREIRMIDVGRLRTYPG